VKHLESMQARPDDAAQRDAFRFGSVRFTTLRRADLQPLVRSWARPAAPSLTMTLTGAHGVTECRRHPAVQFAHDDADFVLCDGTPPWLGAFILGNGRLVDRIPGREAMREIAAAAAALRLQQAFIGGPPGIAERALKGLEAAIGSSIDGSAWSPPFAAGIDDDYADAVADRLRDLRRPAVVWIGLSTPKQELLMQRLRQRLPVGLFFVAVGAAFDMYAGTQPPPPALVSRVGLEWLYRSVQEPRRLPARYARALPVVAAALAVAVWDRLRR
jgi:N-acetylglucosaminyldiphosphoundecaprenol N-acetyl-beta-D-mannosaminyltransferase